MKDGTRQQVSPADAAKMIAALAKRLSVRDLTIEETLAAIELADKRGVQGARIHDLLHARAGTLFGAGKALSRDRSFGSLGEPLDVEWP